MHWRFAWKVYLGLWLGLRVANLSVNAGQTGAPIQYFYAALGVFGAVPIAGFILERRVLSRKVWQAWFVFSLAWAAFDLVAYREWFAAHSLAAQVIGPLLALPSYSALFVYAFGTGRGSFKGAA